MTLHCAIIGSGASAASVIQALNASCTDTDILVFERGGPVISALETQAPAETWDLDYFTRLYADLRAKLGIKFPPPKSHFGESPRQQSVAEWGRIWDSHDFGGLTNFWGGSVLPFPQREMANWPVLRSDLDPHYAAVAMRVGVAGRLNDRLSSVLGGDFVNRPPLWTPPIIDALEQAINSGGPSSAGTVVAGSSRLAVDTAEAVSARGCSYCGQCMLGCPRASIYNAATDMNALVKSGRVRLIRAEVQRIDPDKGEVILYNGERHTFDHVYLAAGCVASTRLVMNSCSLDHGPMMSDNAVFTFPIVYIGPSLGKSIPDRYSSMTNLIAILAPAVENQPMALVQVYPFFDHLWRSFVPPRAWRLFQPLARTLRGRILWGRLYLGDVYSQRYAFDRTHDGSIGLSLNRRGSFNRAKAQWDAIRQGFNRQGFYIPKVPPLRHSTSSHYGGSLPLGGGLVSNEGRWGERAYICDGAAMPSGSALSPTLTIMALAHRTAKLSLA